MDVQNRDVSEVKVAENMIPIVASSDQNYACHMGVMFVSLLENTSCPERCHLVILDGGIEADTRQTIATEVEKRKGTVTFLAFDRDAYQQYPLRRNMTTAAYYRISIPELFAQSVEKVIYLDCDMIVKGDIAELWEFPLDGCHVAAVQNLSNSTYRSLGILQQLYFNSGVMLIDLVQWRRDRIADKVREFKEQNPDRIQTNDQCALNGVLYESWKRLPLRWNHQPGVYRPGGGRLAHFSRQEIDEAIWSPAVIHYISTGKPWRYPCFHPLAEAYYSYRKRTAWAGCGTEERTWSAFFAWSLRPKLLQKYFRQCWWRMRYAGRNGG